MKRGETPDWERLLNLMKAGEVISTLTGRNFFPAIIEVPGRIGDIKKKGYVVNQMRVGRTMGYWLDDYVDHGKLQDFITTGRTA